MATRKDGTGIEVAQCKRYSEITPSQVAQASTEFLKNLDYWRRDNPKRFILFTACGLTDTRLQDQIREERRRFGGEGIAYEAWGSDVIWSKIRQHPELVRTYCGIHWEIGATGSPMTTIVIGEEGDAALKVGNEALTRQLGRLVPELAEAKNKDLELIRDLIGQGRAEEALERVVVFRRSSSWAVLPSEVRSKALRIHATLVLSVRNDIASARGLLLEAKAACPSANFRPLETLLTLEEQGAEAALGFLAQPKTVEEWNFQLQLLLNLGRIDEVQSCLAEVPAGVTPNTDTAWVKGLVLLLDRQLEQARAEIANALKSKPLHFNLRHAMAMIDYAGAVSPAFPAWRHLTWPVPPSWNYVKRDTVSVDRLREAGRAFEESLKLTKDAGRRELQTWHLACLANDHERQEEAKLFVQQVIAETPGHYPVLLWALERGYTFNADPSIAALRQRASDPDVEIDEVLTLCTLLVTQKRFTEAEEVFDAQRQRWVADGAGHLWVLHKAQLLCAHGKTDAALALVDEEKDNSQQRVIKLVVLEAVAKQSGDARPLAQHLEEYLRESPSPHVLMACCRAKRQCGDWQFIAAHARELVQQVATESVLRLALDGSFQARDYDLCLGLLQENKVLLSAGKIPPDLKRLEI